MRPVRSIACFALLLVISAAFPAFPSYRDSNAPSLIPISVLEELARKKMTAKSRVPLAPETAEVFKDLDSLEAPASAKVPNYVRALALLPNAVKPFARLMKTAIYTGAVSPEVKAAMGLRIAQIYSSPYAAAHTRRVLATTERGQAIIGSIKADKLDSLAAAERIALGYAESLTRDVNGVSDEDFDRLKAHYNDSQVVELTMTVCFFNYFTRLCEGLNLPVESWAFDTKPQAASTYHPPAARVALISDDEISATSAAAAAAKESQQQPGSWRIGMANSQRAMLRSPQFALAWRAYGSAVREYAQVSREIKLHVSFAVSMANGCRYCTLHQVLGLRRLGVDPAKLMAMKKSDDALKPTEKKVVEFARKLTREPASITDADWEALKAEFSEQGAMEVLLQTCSFSFMNRFTDGLRLPSEDEAIRVYREVYGSDWK